MRLGSEAYKSTEVPSNFCDAGEEDRVMLKVSGGEGPSHVFIHPYLNATLIVIGVPE